MFRAKSLLDEILGGEASGGMPAAQPAQSWFQTPQAVQDWNYSTETMAGPPGMYADTNLANIIGSQAQGMGYTGPMTVGGNTEADSSLGQVSPEFIQWLQSQNLQLSGESAGVNGVGGVNAFLSDQGDNKVAQQDYATDDTGAFNFGVGLLGLGAGSAINAGVGAAGGASGGASAGLFGGEGAAQLAAADLAVSPEALAAITPEIGGLGEVAALGGSQVAALNPSMFANEGLAQLTANPPVVSAAELSGITPNVSALGAAPANIFANEGAKQLAANPPAVTAAELAKVTPAIEGGGLLGSITGAAGNAVSWLKENPVLGRLLMSGAGALVSGLGGSGGGSASTGSTNYGPAKQWTSPVQSGLLSAPRNVQQVQPGGLLGGQGVANSGAWQWRK